MKLKSSNKIEISYNIDEIIKNKALVTFIDLSSEQKEEEEQEGIKIVEYTYDAFQIELINNEEYIKDNYDTLLEQARQFEYNKIANEVREKRRLLLEETDNYAMSDRVMSNEMKTYRQELRDITTQEGFPYNVIFPTKPL